MKPYKTGSKTVWISTIAAIVLMLLILVFSNRFGSRSYYIAGILMILCTMIPFFAGFEGRKLQARELVTIAVMCAIAVISRAAFIMLPQVKPIVGIIMITGMALGPAAGFLTGAVSAFVSNFIFGQGPWTPWQMFAFGLAGFVAGLLSKAGILKPEKRLPVAVFGGLFTMLIVGPILDTCTLFMMSSMVDRASVAAIYLAGLPFNAVHAAAVFVTLLLLCRPIAEKLERIQIKYGMMESSQRDDTAMPDGTADDPENDRKNDGQDI